MKNSLKHVEFLDHLRGVAILGVLLSHTAAAVFAEQGSIPWLGWYRDFSGSSLESICLFPLGFGQGGVAIFFVISGFCIHMSFHQQGQRWGPFFIRRFFRIYPAYFAALAFFALLLSAKHPGMLFQNPDDRFQLLMHVFLIHNFHPVTFAGINMAFWSLAVEAQLYLVYPILLYIVARVGWRQAMVLLGVCEVLIRGSSGLMDLLGATDSFGGKLSSFFADSVLGYWFSWALGAFIADAFLKNRPLPFLRISPGWWLVLAVSGYFFRPMGQFWFLFFALTTAAVISRLLSGGRLEIKVPAIITHIFKNFGLWSYSIYLLHLPLLTVYGYFIMWAVPEEYRPPFWAFLMLIGLWLVIIPFSVVWYGIIELPGIALGKWIIGKTAAINNHTVARFLPSWSGTWRLGVMIGALFVFMLGSFFINARFSPKSAEECNNLAWSLATSPETSQRNGILAIKLAGEACQQTHYQKTVMVGTLAAAYAEAGRFAEAISTAQKACELAVEHGESNLLQSNQELLKLYQSHLPYREQPNAQSGVVPER